MFQMRPGKHWGSQPGPEHQDSSASDSKEQEGSVPGHFIVRRFSAAGPVYEPEEEESHS